MSHDVLLDGVWYVWERAIPGPSGTHSDSEQDEYVFRDANGFRRTVIGTRERIMEGDRAELAEAFALYPLQEPVPTAAPDAAAPASEPAAQPPAPAPQPVPEPQPGVPEPDASSDGDASPTPEPTPQ